MKIISLMYLILILAIVSCNKTTNNSQSKNEFYSIKIDTSYSLSDRTKIEEIKRYIYLKQSTKATKSLSLSKIIKGNSKDFKFTIIKIDATDIQEVESSILSFKNEEELQQLFLKVDSVEEGKSLKERKKTKHYEITKYNNTIEIEQFNSSINKSNKITLTTLEYDGLKAAFEKYALEESK